MEEYYRVVADIDLDAIRKNIMTMRGCLPEGKKLLGVIKANAYGHGSIEVANALLDLVDYFGVACIDEGVELRRAGIKLPILTLGHTDRLEYETAVINDITLTIFSSEEAKVLSNIAKGLGKTAKVHIKLDTGMNRIGYHTEDEYLDDTVADIVKISTLDGIDMEGIFTHYFKADAIDKTSAKEQYERYTKVINALEDKGIKFAIRHISNSAGIMEMDNSVYDMGRSGISTYGLYPSDEMDMDACKLYPAMTFKTRVTHVKTVKKGESIGYGATYVADHDIKVATIGVGYADGYKRALSNKARVLVRGEFANVVGRVCMDQVMIDVTEIPDVEVGDEVVLFGKQGDKEIPVEEPAAMASSFNYEFVCDINRRVPRRFIRDGKVVSVKKYLLD